MDNDFINISNQLQKRFGIIGQSQPIRNAVQMLMQAAPTDLSVLITGATGTGKEVFATAIHKLSKRKNAPLVSVNCGAIPETLLESELFGHEKGAFTGAHEQRKGFFEVADKGTIFLDEIGEMPIGTQVKLLRVLESGEFNRIGSTKLLKVDVRVVAATNRELEQEIKDGQFRQDLFFRLNSVHIFLPPLKMHKEDIPELIEHFSGITADKIDLDFKGFSTDSIALLKSLPWPGNIRELKNLIETVITLERKTFITDDVLRRYLAPALPPYVAHEPVKETSIVHVQPKDEVNNFELNLIFRTLLELQNTVSGLSHEVIKMRNDLHDLKSFALQAQEEFQEVQEMMSDEDEVKFYADKELNLQDMEKKLVESALQRFDGNRKNAAVALGISERTLYRKISEYDLENTK